MTRAIQEKLNAQNGFTYLCARFTDGLRAISPTPAKAALATLYWVAALLLLLHAAGPTDGILEHLMQPLVCTLVVRGSIVLFVTGVTVSALPKGIIQLAYAFRRAGVTNSAGEPPLTTSCQEKDGRTIVDLYTQGITISQVQDNLEPLESTLGKRISKIEPGDGNQSIRLHLAPGNAKLPEVAYLPQGQPPKPPKILLGASLDGPVIWDPDKVPHLLVGGSTGSGKTTLAKSIISQFVLMVGSDGKPAADVYITDLKVGLDYPSRWQNQDCSFTTTAGDTLAVTSQIIKELNRRKDMYHQVSNREGVPCSSLEDFNSRRPDGRLHRILLVIDEITELTDTTGMDKPRKEEAAAIVSNLATIARLGRAFGIHLIVSTQRPDAMVVPGQIKNNLDGRICGKADNVLSQIILDKTDATDRIPKDSQGLFLNQDGVLFRGYLFDDRQKVSAAAEDDPDWEDDDDDGPAWDDSSFWDCYLDDEYNSDY